MKKRILTIGLMAAILSLSSCDKYFEDSVASPNNPSEVTPALLLSNIEVATFANFGGQLARQTQMMVQQVAGTNEGSQTTEVMNYNITELTNENEWGVIYTGALVNGKIIIDDFGAENPHYAGIAKIIMALNLGSATDLWGDVPYSDALKGLEGELTTNYDMQSALYDDANPNSLFALLDDAIADLSQPSESNTFVPGADDIIFGGNIDMWTKTAYSLKARFYNHLSEVDPAGSATDALGELTNGITSSAENAMMYFGSGNSQNQWFAYENARPQYIKMGEFFVDELMSSSDPRLPFYADMDTAGSYSGTPLNDISQTWTSDVGSYLSSVNSAIPLVSFAEMKFIEAEAQMRAGNAPLAATALNEAVEASLLEVTGSADAAYILAYGSETGLTINMEKIMYQKYVALFGQIEVYTDFRRTGLPDLTPRQASGVQLNIIPLRLILPQNERLYNPAAAEFVKDLDEPVWWDQ